MKTQAQPIPKTQPNLLIRLAGRAAAPSEKERIRWPFSSYRQSTHNAEIQHLAAFGRISANLLHEITNPLTSALLNLELHDANGARQLLAVRKSLQQLERYVKAARQQLQLESNVITFSVQPQITQLLHVMKPLAQRAGVRLHVEHIGRHFLLGEPIKFQQLLSNLLMNAIQAYEGHALPRATVRLTIRRSGPWLILIITDYGKGISGNELGRLFEPFYSTKARAGKGLGLGLALVKHIVEQDFDGHISVSSSPYTGTQFVVRLKAYEPASQIK